jgi:hypothetical protein
MKRSTLILAGVLILLAIAAFFALRKQGESSSEGLPGEKLVAYDSAAVDRITIRTAAANVVLQKEAGRWMVTSPFRYAADEGMVLQAVSKGNSLLSKGVVSTNPQKQQLFQVDSTGTLVTVFEKGVEKAAFRVGKPGPSYNETYVRKEGSNEVHLGDGLFTYYFNRQPKEWRDRTIQKVDRLTVREVVMRYGDTTTVLAMRDSVWRIDTTRAADGAVQSYLSTLSTLQADDFVDSTVSRMPPLSYTISVGGADIRFFFNPAANKYYVLSSATPQVFEIQEWRAQQILKRKKDFLQ